LPQFPFLYVNKARKEVAAAGPVFEQLDPKSFPALKEIQMDDIKWPTSECVIYVL
jgi:hypothetical protein